MWTAGTRSLFTLSADSLGLLFALMAGNGADNARRHATRSCGQVKLAGLNRRHGRSRTLDHFHEFLELARRAVEPIRSPRDQRIEPPSLQSFDESGVTRPWFCRVRAHVVVDEHLGDRPSPLSTQGLAVVTLAFDAQAFAASVLRDTAVDHCPDPALLFTRRHAGMIR